MLNIDKIIFFALTTGVFTLFTVSSFAETPKNVSDGLSECLSYEDDSKRLTCYDSLANSHAQRASKNTEQARELPTTLGGSKFDDREKVQVQNVGVVKSCQKSQDGRWFYIFEDGQVWKQVDRVKRRYKGCKFNVTITKDGFGYKMQIADQTSTIRIRRHR